MATQYIYKPIIIILEEELSFLFNSLNIYISIKNNYIKHTCKYIVKPLKLICMEKKVLDCKSIVIYLIIFLIYNNPWKFIYMGYH